MKSVFPDGWWAGFGRAAAFGRGLMRPRFPLGVPCVVMVYVYTVLKMPELEKKIKL